MSKIATPGFCPYCRTALNPDATACTGCGAFETTGWVDLKSRKGYLPGFLLLVAGPFLAIFAGMIWWVLGLIVFFGSPIYYFIMRYRLARRVVWVIGGGARSK